MLEDGTWITTKWVVIIMIPLIPLGSYVVLDYKFGLITEEYKLIKIRLDWKQVLKTYLAAISVIMIIIIILSIIMHFD